MTTLAPVKMPLNSPTIKKIRWLEEPTAASASLPRKLPTTSESTTL